jgi:hypothetical protein
MAKLILKASKVLKSGEKACYMEVATREVSNKIETMTTRRIWVPKSQVILGTQNEMEQWIVAKKEAEIASDFGADLVEILVEDEDI